MNEARESYARARTVVVVAKQLGHNKLWSAYMLECKRRKMALRYWIIRVEYLLNRPHRHMAGK